MLRYDMILDSIFHIQAENSTSKSAISKIFVKVSSNSSHSGWPWEFALNPGVAAKVLENWGTALS